MIKEAKALGDLLIVVVNNDRQQMAKKGRIIIRQEDRAEVVESLLAVDRVIISVDTDTSVQATLEGIVNEYPGQAIVFANGGDRRNAESIDEAMICKRMGIETVFGVGGDGKADASSRIIAESGL
jgi:glycerol-3-phosphate cytidylyltransferase/D-beta-D-heptose 7-phosphate kinase/D-beta-D-heptose 1-phosphate adenosyltransferase